MSSSKSKSGRLNGFQLMMLQWNELHPYNAVHVVRLSEPLDFARLQTAVNTTLEQQGLTGLHFAAARGTYHYAGGPAQYPVDQIAPRENPEAALHAEVERQLNSRFTLTDSLLPFRFFVIRAKQSFALGLSYFHSIADAESIVRLLKGIAETYRGAKPNSAPLDCHPPRQDAAWQKPLVFIKKLTAWPAQMRNMRRSCRPAYRNSADMNNGFLFCSLPEGALNAVLAASKAWGVTVNDLFLALLMKALSPFASGRARGNRSQLTVGCIVNTRKDLLWESNRVFGLFLGSFAVTHAVPEGMPLVELAKAVQRATASIKAKKLYLGMPLEMVFGGRLLPFFSLERRKKLYPKHYPLWGGITNMNLNALWDSRDPAGSVDYFRAVSTGPVTPLVLSVTTVKETINIGLTYRTTVFGPDQIQQVKNFFVEMMEKQLVDTTPSGE